jgi:hypothetical protein
MDSVVRTTRFFVVFGNVFWQIIKWLLLYAQSSQTESLGPYGLSTILMFSSHDFSNTNALVLMFYTCTIVYVQVNRVHILTTLLSVTKTV